MGLLVLAALLLLADEIRGTPPTCAVLFLGDGAGCGGSETTIWVGAAQTEAARFFHTANGGWLTAACASDHKARRVEPLDFNYKHTFCLHPTDPHDIPAEKCHAAHCNFAAHPELTTGECADADGEPNPCGQACRSLEAWIKIATEKLALALDYQEQCDFAQAVSHACVAELLFGHINAWIASAAPAEALVFANAHARQYQHYKHINSKLRSATYTEVDVVVRLRGWQSLRFCDKRANQHLKRSLFSAAAQRPGDNVAALGKGGKRRRDDDDDEQKHAHRVSSVFIFSHYDGTELDTVDESTAVQIVLAPTGLLPNFEGTLGDAGLADGRGKLCADMNVDTTLEPIQLDTRLDGLTVPDWAVVRNDGAPRQTKSFSASTCSAVVLFNDLRKGSAARSLAHIQLREEPRALQPCDFAARLESQSFLRNAAVDACFDEEPTHWADALESPCGDSTPSPPPPPPPGGEEPGFEDYVLEYGDEFVRPKAGYPATLSPTESRCVGGDAAGDSCTVASECGPGFSCQRLAGGARDVAYCFDGIDFDKKRPCAFAGADDQCPFGECFGEANGNAGGAYPLLFFYQANDCKRNPRSAVCQERSVLDWFQYRNPAAFNVATKK